MKFSRLQVRLIALLSVVLALPSCGGGGGGSSDNDTNVTPTSLTPSNNKLEIVLEDFDIEFDILNAKRLISKINREAGFYDHKPETNNNSDSSSCYDTSIEPFRLTDTTLGYYELSIKSLDLADCITSSTSGTYETSIYLLKGTLDSLGNPVNIDGMTLDEARGDRSSRETFYQLREDVVFNVDSDIQTIGKSVLLESSSSNLNETCKLDNLNSTILDCQKMSLFSISTPSFFEAPTDVADRKSFAYKNVAFSEDGTYFISGTIEFTINNWTGTMVYDAPNSDTPPTFSATNGSAVIEGTLGSDTLTSYIDENSEDTDLDGEPNIEDRDDDGDGPIDEDDAYPLDPNRANFLTTQISASRDRTCALTEEGVFCWGLSFSRENRVPKSLENPTQIYAGTIATCALANGEVRCWGSDLYGQTDVPTDLKTPTLVFLSYAMACAVTDEGLRCWGEDYALEEVPSDLMNPTTFSAGEYHVCALTDTGVRCWGAGQAGETDFPNDGQSVVPPNLLNPTAIAAGEYHSCALTTNGVVCWGNDTYGQISVPTDLENPRAIAAGANHTCALTDNGVQCWGRNSNRQIDVPPDLVNPTAITAGREHTCAITDNGVICWGPRKYVTDKQPKI